jgi:hypothetical protein
VACAFPMSTILCTAGALAHARPPDLEASLFRVI